MPTHIKEAVIRYGRLRAIYSAKTAGVETSIADISDASTGKGPAQAEIETLQFDDKQLTQATASYHDFQGIPVPMGLTVVLGAAGTGKTTTLRSLKASLSEQGAAVHELHVNEPDYDDDIGSDGWHHGLATAVGRALNTGAGSVIIVDSVRHFSTVSTGYPSRLGASGFDLTTLQALSDLDRLARRLRISICAALFLSTYQITRGDLGNDEAQRKILRTLAADIDGCVATTILMGPLRREAGDYTATSRLLRDEVFTGHVRISKEEPSITSVTGWRQIGPIFAPVRSAARAEAVVFAEGLAKTPNTRSRSLKLARRDRVNPDPQGIMPSDPAALAETISARDELEKGFLPAPEEAGSDD